MPDKERCIFVVEQQGGMFSGDSEGPCCSLSDFRPKCDGIKDKARCPFWNKKGKLHNKGGED